MCRKISFSILFYLLSVSVNASEFFLEGNLGQLSSGVTYSYEDAKADTRKVNEVYSLPNTYLGVGYNLNSYLGFYSFYSQPWYEMHISGSLDIQRSFNLDIKKLYGVGVRFYWPIKQLFVMSAFATYSVIDMDKEDTVAGVFVQRTKSSNHVAYGMFGAGLEYLFLPSQSLQLNYSILPQKQVDDDLQLQASTLSLGFKIIW